MRPHQALPGAATTRQSAVCVRRAGRLPPRRPCFVCCAAPSQKQQEPQPEPSSDWEPEAPAAAAGTPPASSSDASTSSSSSSQAAALATAHGADPHSGSMPAPTSQTPPAAASGADAPHPGDPGPWERALAAAVFLLPLAEGLHRVALLTLQNVRDSAFQLSWWAAVHRNTIADAGAGAARGGGDLVSIPAVAFCSGGCTL
jgi:hypothetical protein